VGEFETALRGSNRKKEVDALSMIALCRMTQSRPRDAIEALKRAMRSDYLNKEAARAIHFDLGSAFEAAGEPQVGLWYFQKVARVDPAYRQVAARVAGLGGGAGKAPADEAGRSEARTPANGAAGAPGTPAARPAAAAPPANPGPKKNIGYL